jgi:hypothetical protein
MKVLILSGNFLRGGLERQIMNQVESLNDQVEFIFAFASYQKTDLFDRYAVYHEPAFGDFSVKGFLNSVDSIVNIIHKENIDFIHVHPFDSLFLGMFASQIANIPLAFTLHGILSLNYYNNNIVQKILFNYFLSDMDPLVFSVNNHFESVLRNKYGIKNLVYLPNSLDSSEFAHIKAGKENHWILVSRLDYLKYFEVEAVITNIDRLNIEKIDIYGDGEKRADLEILVNSLGLTDRISFKGATSNIIGAYNQGYKGVIGLGQVVLEGISASLPVLLAGYGRITGLVDLALFNRIKGTNFINTFEPDVDIDLIGKQILSLDDNYQNYILKDSIIEFDNQNVWNKYLNEIKDKIFVNNLFIKKLYGKMQVFKENSEFDNENIFNSEKILNLIKEALAEYPAFNSDIINLLFENINLNKKIEYLNAQLKEQILFDYEVAKSENMLLKERIEALELKVNNIGLRQVTNRTISTIKNKFKK